MASPKKKPRIMQKWREDYGKEFPGIISSKLSENHAFSGEPWRPWRCYKTRFIGKA
jgi:hypothetical protein